MARIWPAALVHCFTALGAVCALLAARAGLAGAWEIAFGWLAVAVVIDGVDGSLARRVDVRRRLPRFSGDRLDLVVDYVTYVFVPVFLLLQTDALHGGFGLLLAALILLSSLYHFSDTEAKTSDNSFVGFPAIWNVVAFYIFALEPEPWVTQLAVIFLVTLTFVPLSWPHPVRTRFLLPLTLLICGVASLAMIHTLLAGFPASPLPAAILFVAGAYIVLVSLLRGPAR